jgi:hypothetical protein
MRTTRCVRSDCGGSTVLSAFSSRQVSFYTTAGEWIALLNQVWGLEGCRSFLSAAYKSLS